jgi:sugar fermentation stimulation protein A
MQFSSPTVIGTIHKRYKRFLADIELSNGEIITAHTANTGSMQSCWAPGWEVLLSYHNNPKRKLKYSLEMTHNSHSWIGVNTSRTNALAKEALLKGVVTEFPQIKDIQSEVTVGESRLDFCVYDLQDETIYIEVKNVTLKERDGFCTFPDSVSTRGQKHLQTLRDLVQKGHRAAMLYIVQREDCHTFSPAYEFDPVYAELLEEAYREGVQILVYDCRLGPEGIEVSKAIPFTFMKEDGSFWGPA